MDEEELRKKRIANLKPWKRGQTGNPHGRSKIKSYKELAKKWLSLPIDKLDLQNRQLEKLTTQEYFYVSFLKACINECKKENPSYFKLKDLNQTLQMFIEKNGITEKEENRIAEMFDFDEDELESLKSIFKNKMKEESKDEHKVKEDQEDSNEQEEV